MAPSLQFQVVAGRIRAPLRSPANVRSTPRNVDWWSLFPTDLVLNFSWLDVIEGGHATQDAGQVRSSIRAGGGLRRIGGAQVPRRASLAPDQVGGLPWLEGGQVPRDEERVPILALCQWAILRRFEGGQGPQDEKRVSIFDLCRWETCDGSRVARARITSSACRSSPRVGGRSATVRGWPGFAGRQPATILVRFRGGSRWIGGAQVPEGPIRVPGGWGSLRRPEGGQSPRHEKRVPIFAHRTCGLPARDRGWSVLGARPAVSSSASKMCRDPT